MTAMSDKMKIAVAVILGAISFVAAAATAKFPGVSELRSPNRHWAILSEPPTAEGDHRLLLKSLSDGTSRTLLSFPRHVEAAWAPSSKRVAVTNYFASDSSDCLIFSVKGGKPLSALDILSQSSLKAVVVGNHHVYVKCGSWKGSVAVDVEIDAYGDNNPDGKKIRTRIDVAKRAIVSRATP